MEARNLLRAVQAGVDDCPIDRIPWLTEPTSCARQNAG